MKILTVFNNKGGVGKTTLLFNTAHAIASLGKKVLVVDCDPQCNLSLNFLSEQQIEKIWDEEDDFVAYSYQQERDKDPKKFQNLIKAPRSIHFLLKPTEEGIDDPQSIPKPFIVNDNLHLIPGRLTLYIYEDYISRRWNDLYAGTPLAIRTVVKVRNLCALINKENLYDYILIDTSPSLGALNKSIIIFSDYFMIPCNPDWFSLFGIKNIGNSLMNWKKDMAIIYSLLSDKKRSEFPEKLVQFIGYCLYKAKRYKSKTNDLDLAQGHYHNALKIPKYIERFIGCEMLEMSKSQDVSKPIGGKSIMHSDNTAPAISQILKVPIWQVPDRISQQDASKFFDDPKLYNAQKNTISGNSKYYTKRSKDYQVFAQSLMRRMP